MTWMADDAGYAPGRLFPPLTADPRAVALMGCRPLIGTMDGIGIWHEDLVRARFRCTLLAWFLATVELQRRGQWSYALYAALEASAPWQDIALEDIAQGSIDSAGVLWLATRLQRGNMP